MTDQDDLDDLEEPDADAAEQHQDVIPEPDEDLEEMFGEPGTPLEANPADTAEQEQEIGSDDDEYR